VISNVPATILLSPMAAGKWRDLLYGVNAGGCGTIIASLANLLGWRIYVRGWNRDPRFFWRLTALNFAFLAWAAIGGWILLSARLPRFDRAPRGTHRPASTSASTLRSLRPIRASIRVAPSAHLPTSPSSD
jgi:hypothetical protein